MAVVRYIARRSLVSPTVEGDTVTLNLPAKYAGITRSRESFGHQRVSLSGQRESYYYRGENSYAIATYPLAPAAAAALVMFLESAEDGQVFEFSAYQTSPGSITWVSAVMGDTTYTETPVPMRQDRRMFEFRIIEVP